VPMPVVDLVDLVYEAAGLGQDAPGSENEKAS
jgi:hypothetical protein